MVRIADRVVVITGASSAIGRAAAAAFARGQARVVLASWRPREVEALARACQDMGTEAVLVPSDLDGEPAVARIARAALDAFGRIDVWVNNAAQPLPTRGAGVPAEEVARVLETSLAGYIHGARQALEAFRGQGEGVLINVAAPVMRLSPDDSSHVATRSAIRELSECLRAELRLEEPHRIHVCTALPDRTVAPELARPGSDRGADGAAQRVARALVGLARVPRLEVVVGRGAAGIGAAAAFPLITWLLARRSDRGSPVG